MSFLFRTLNSNPLFKQRIILNVHLYEFDIILCVFIITRGGSIQSIMTMKNMPRDHFDIQNIDLLQGNTCEGLNALWGLFFYSEVFDGHFS